jgi:hypothetical protein
LYLLFDCGHDSLFKYLDYLPTIQLTHSHPFLRN